MDKRRTDIKKKIIRMTEQTLSQIDSTKLSLRELANKCGVSAATMYKHFSSKDDLFQQVHLRLAKRKLDLFKEVEPETADFKEKIVSLANHILNEFERDPMVMDFVFLSSYSAKSFPKSTVAENKNLLDEYAKYISGIKKTIESSRN